jgi:uncharacterized protein
MLGLQDKQVGLHETEEIFSHFKEPKTLRTYASAGHENYLSKYQNEWTNDLKAFLKVKLFPKVKSLPLRYSEDISQ